MQAATNGMSDHIAGCANVWITVFGMRSVEALVPRRRPSGVWRHSKSDQTDGEKYLKHPHSKFSIAARTARCHCD
jgi:hypothetical protein